MRGISLTGRSFPHSDEISSAPRRVYRSRSTRRFCSPIMKGLGSLSGSQLSIPCLRRRRGREIYARLGATAPPPSGQTYCTNLHGNLGRNTVIGPGLSKLDFSVFKNNHVKRISEEFNVQFRAEIFNILNRANFLSPTDNFNVFDGNGSRVDSAGLLDSTQTPGRQIQFALKMIW